MSEELILKIKDALDFTFDDKDTDRKIVGIIEDATVNLRSLFGVPDDEEVDWIQPSTERFLLKNYCLYELNHVSEQFNDNYRNEIMQVRKKYEVNQWKNLQNTTME